MRAVCDWSLHQNANTRSVEVKNLDPVAAFVTEDKQSAAFGILAQLLLGGGPEAGETRAPIARGRGEEHFQVGVET